MMNLNKACSKVLFCGLLVICGIVSVACDTGSSPETKNNVPAGIVEPPGGPETLKTVDFSYLVQTGGTYNTAKSTGLVLSFSDDPTTLTANDITLSGAVKGALSGVGTTRFLELSSLSVANGSMVSVSIANPVGFSITGSPRTAVVYQRLAVGENYLGGKIAYIFQQGDTGYEDGVIKGLIASISDVSDGCPWALQSYQHQSVYVTFAAIGAGSDNTDAIVTQNGGSSGFAAGMCVNYQNIDTGTGVYSDWYLPSRSELYKLYLNKALIGGFADDLYWTSTQFDKDVAWSISFSNGYNEDTYLKGSALYVRAVRSF